MCLYALFSEDIFWGRSTAPRIPNLTLGGVSGHIHPTLALPPETGSLLHDAGWAPELVWKL